MKSQLDAKTLWKNHKISPNVNWSQVGVTPMIPTNLNGALNCLLIILYKSTLAQPKEIIGKVDSQSTCIGEPCLQLMVRENH